MTIRQSGAVAASVAAAAIGLTFLVGLIVFLSLRRTGTGIPWNRIFTFPTPSHDIEKQSLADFATDGLRAVDASSVATNGIWTLCDGDFHDPKNCIISVQGICRIDKLRASFPYVKVDEEQMVVVIPIHHADYFPRSVWTRRELRSAKAKSAVKRAAEARPEEWKGAFGEEGWAVLQATKGTIE